MSTADVEVVGPEKVAPVEEEPHGLTSLPRRALDNLRSGNLGVLPIALGIVFIVAFFSFKATNFFTASSLDHSAGPARLAISPSSATYHATR